MTSTDILLHNFGIAYMYISKLYIIWRFLNALFIRSEGVVTTVGLQCGIKLNERERKRWVCENLVYDVLIYNGVTSYEPRILNLVVQKLILYEMCK